MKLILQYDPWGETVEAKRAAEALNTLGLATELCEVRPARPAPKPDGPVKFGDKQ
jgi:hypothetical protein